MELSLLDILCMDVINHIIESIPTRTSPPSSDAYDKDLLNVSLVCRAFLSHSRKINYLHITLTWTEDDPARSLQDIVEILNSPRNTILANITRINVDYWRGSTEGEPSDEQVEKHRAAIDTHLPRLIRALPALKAFEFAFARWHIFDWDSSSEEFKIAFETLCMQPSVKRLEFHWFSCPLDIIARACRRQVEDLSVYHTELSDAEYLEESDTEGSQACEDVVSDATPTRNAEPSQLRSFHFEFQPELNTRMWTSDENSSLFASLTELTVALKCHEIQLLSSLISCCASTLSTLGMWIEELPDDDATFCGALGKLPALRNCMVDYMSVHSSNASVASYEVMMDFVKSILDAAPEIEEMNVHYPRESGLSLNLEDERLVLNIVRALTNIPCPGPPKFTIYFFFELAATVTEETLTKEEFQKKYYNVIRAQLSRLWGDVLKSRASPTYVPDVLLWLQLERPGFPRSCAFSRVVPKNPEV